MMVDNILSSQCWASASYRRGSGFLCAIAEHVAHGLHVRSLGPNRGSACDSALT
jgi:hypothetical protein